MYPETEEVYVVRQPVHAHRSAQYTQPYQYHYVQPASGEYYEEDYVEEGEPVYYYYEEERQGGLPPPPPGYVYEYPEQPIYRPPQPVYRHVPTSSNIIHTPLPYQYPQPGYTPSNRQNEHHDRTNHHKMVKKRAIRLINENSDKSDGRIAVRQ